MDRRLSYWEAMVRGHLEQENGPFRHSRRRRQPASSLSVLGDTPSETTTNRRRIFTCPSNACVSTRNRIVRFFHFKQTRHAWNGSGIAVPILLVDCLDEILVRNCLMTLCPPTHCTTVSNGPSNSYDDCGGASNLHYRCGCIIAVLYPVVLYQCIIQQYELCVVLYSTVCIVDLI